MIKTWHCYLIQATDDSTKCPLEDMCKVVENLHCPQKPVREEPLPWSLDELRKAITNTSDK